MEFKGSVMSLGSSCCVAAMLSNLGIRESGALDWVRNEDGIKGVTNAFSGALELALKCGRYTFTTWRKPNEFGVDTTIPVPKWEGMIFSNLKLYELTTHWYLDKITKLREFASQGGLFVYYPFKSEDVNEKSLFFLKCIFEESGLEMEDQLLVLPNRAYDDYYGVNTKECKLACTMDLENRIQDYFGFVPPKRKDFNPNILK